MMSREITELEIRQGRHRLILRKVTPGEWLRELHGAAASFFYEVSLDGSVRTFTADAQQAQAICRGCMRWLRTGHSTTAEVLP
jgi:hypothetical protein